MAVLKTTFDMVDRMSAKLDAMASKGEQTMQKFDSAGQAADRSLGTAGETADKTARSINDLEASTTKMEKAVKAYNYDQDEGVKLLRDFINEVDGADEAFNNYIHGTEKAAKATEELGHESEITGRKTEEAGKKTADAADSISQLIAAAGVVTVIRAIGNAFGEAVTDATAFETKLAQIATVADNSIVSMSDISDGIEDLSLDTGKALEDLSDSAYQAISSGVDTAEAVKFTADSVKLAVGGFASTATAVDLLTTIMNSYNKSIEETGHISDVLIQTQNLGKTTVNELSSAMGVVIPTAATYKVSIENLSAAYALMTSVGINTAISTTSINSMLNELGDTSSAVSKKLKELSGDSFADLMSKGKSLGDVINMLSTSVNGNATAFAGLWGSTEASRAALSLFNSGSDKFNATLDKMSNSAGAASKAYQTMADTAGNGLAKMRNAGELLSVSIGRTFTPAIEKAADLISRMLSGIKDFVDDHPKAVKAIAALAVGIVAFTAVVTTYTAVVKLATIAQEAFNLVTNPAALLITGAVIAATAAIAVFTAMTSNANEEYTSLTVTSKNQYDMLQELNAEYDRACEVYGATSYEAQQLQWRIEDLNTEYENSKQTMAEWNEKQEAVIENHNKIVSTYENSVAKIDAEFQSIGALVTALENLSAKTLKTTGDKEAMLAIIDALNEKLPGLQLSYEKVAGSAGNFAEAIRKMAEAELAQQKHQADYEAYVALVAAEPELLAAKDDASNKAAEAQNRYNAALEAYSARMERLKYTDPTVRFQMSKEERDALEAAKIDLDNYNQMLNQTASAYSENRQKQQETIDGMQEYSEMMAATSTISSSYALEVKEALSSVTEDLDKLALQYDTVYEAARSSIDQQIGLFVAMKTESQLTTDQMLANWQTQVDYLSKYTENLQKAAEYGLDKGLIASLSDGSAQSAGYLNAIIEKMDKLSNSTTGLSDDAKKFRDDFNKSFEQTQTAKDRFAGTVAEISTNFNTKMDEIETRLESSVNNMNLSDTAAEAARETIQAYIDKIKSMTGEAHNAAAAVKQATENGLTGNRVTSGGMVDPALVGLPGYASGTARAANAFIAGEEGPELIVGAGGSRVFTANETAQILGTAYDAPLYVKPSAGLDFAKESADGDSSQERKIILELAGSGSISVDRNMSREEILELLLDNMRPALKSVLQQEIFEEGDLDYDF